MKTYNKLKFVGFGNIESWSAYSILEKRLRFSNKYKLVKIKTFLSRNKTSIKIEDNNYYKRPTIRINGAGISLRDKVKGEKIGTKSQFLIKKGQFLLSKIDARNGAFGVVPEELEGGVITGNFWTFDVNYNVINPYFLQLITKTKQFQDLSQSASVGTTNRNYLQEESFLNFSIPLPPLSEQETIVKNYYDKITQATTYEQQAETLEKNIESYLFESLGIEQKTEGKTKKKGLQFVEFYKMDFWGVDYNFSSSDKFFESVKFENTKLKNVALINPITYFPNDENLSISFIPMECISDKEGKVIEQRERLIKESKGYTKFQNGDLLWARITPCMQNGKSAIVSNLKNGYGVGSTEYHIIRQKNTEVELKYIYNILRMNTILQKAMSFFTGSAGQQRVPRTFLEELTIPIPPKETQQAIINQIDTYKNKIKILRERATLLKQQAEQEFEQTIFS